MTTIEETISTACVPIDVLEALLRDHLADPTAVITDCASAPFLNQGTNDGNTFFRVTLSWSLLKPSVGSHAATWIVKHWRAGGARDSALGITQPREVLAWERGCLRPDALPAGVVIPFIGTWRAPDNSAAWLAMADVSAELGAYPRLGLSADQVISRSEAILARLAHFHAMWEQPERQAELRALPWLRRPETSLWDMTPTYANALGQRPVAHAPANASGPPAWEGLSADVDAFLKARPRDEQRLWEHLLIDRRRLVEGLAGYPPTLLHNDLDDRNIGLRGPSGAAGPPAPDLPELILIDWEWMALGPAAIDVANIVQRLPVMITLGTPVPAAIWSDDLADGYFAHYRAAGGRCADAAAWRRSYDLALVAQGLAQMPFIHGSLRRAMRGDIPLPQIIGVPEAVIRQNLQAGLPMMEQMEERVIRAARRSLG